MIMGDTGAQSGRGIAEYGTGDEPVMVSAMRRALERLRSCPHACVPPCPHSRRFDEVTRDLLPPRRVKSYPVETGRG